MASSMSLLSSDRDDRNTVKVKIPPKLLQINETAYTDKWSKDTFHYCHVFDKNITTFTVPQSETSNDLHLWKMKAKNLTHEIKNKGMIAGREEICRIANQYNMKVPGRPDHNNNCTTIDDVLHVIVDKNWYRDNVHLKRCIIYHLLYGITRSGHNTWLLNCEKEWMDNVGIMYDPTKIAAQRKTKVKGFVYSIMLSMFSNSMQKIFRKTMLEHYGEFITVRKKQQDPNATIKYDYTRYEFGNNKQGYLVTVKTSNVDLVSINDIINATNLEDKGKVWVSKCKDANLSCKQIEKMVKMFYFGPSAFESSSILPENNDSIALPDDTLLPKSSTHSSVRKMPNREVQDILAQTKSTTCGE